MYFKWVPAVLYSPLCDGRAETFSADVKLPTIRRRSADPCHGSLYLRVRCVSAVRWATQLPTTHKEIKVGRLTGLYWIEIKWLNHFFSPTIIISKPTYRIPNLYQLSCLHQQTFFPMYPCTTANRTFKCRATSVSANRKFAIRGADIQRSESLRGRTACLLVEK